MRTVTRSRRPLGRFYPRACWTPCAGVFATAIFVARPPDPDAPSLQAEDRGNHLAAVEQVHLVETPAVERRTGHRALSSRCRVHQRASGDRIKLTTLLLNVRMFISPINGCGPACNARVTLLHGLGSITAPCPNTGSPLGPPLRWLIKPELRGDQIVHCWGGLDVRVICRSPRAII
jgi:hypothetical protein